MKLALIKAVQLLGTMLEIDPRSRLSAKQCLEHEYLTRFHDPAEESEAAEKFDWSFNQADLSVDTLKVYNILNKLIIDHNVQRDIGFSSPSGFGCRRFDCLYPGYSLSIYSGIRVSDLILLLFDGRSLIVDGEYGL